MMTIWLALSVDVDTLLEALVLAAAAVVLLVALSEDV